MACPASVDTLRQRIEVKNVSKATKRVPGKTIVALCIGSCICQTCPRVLGVGGCLDLETVPDATIVATTEEDLGDQYRQMLFSAFGQPLGTIGIELFGLLFGFRIGTGIVCIGWLHGLWLWGIDAVRVLHQSHEIGGVLTSDPLAIRVRVVTRHCEKGKVEVSG